MMNFPSVTRYNLAILKQGKNAFSTLDDGEFVTVKNHPFKEYCFSTGTFAAIYKIKGSSGEYAIRCFLSAREEALQRYTQIGAYLKHKDLPWAVSFSYLEDEITVDGNLYPVVKMGWVNGKPINNFIDEIIFDYRKLSGLQQKLVALQKNLEQNQIGHGDLQCGNILVEKQQDDFNLKLVDYDGMYIPAFQGLSNMEAGRQEFQHPKRSPSDYSERIDRFSVWVMLTAIEAIKIDKNLWKQVTQGGFNTFDNILFNGVDFADPDCSPLFERLRRLDHKVLNFYLDRLYASCMAASLDEIEQPCIYQEAQPDTEEAVDQLSAGDQFEATRATSQQTLKKFASRTRLRSSYESVSQTVPLPAESAGLQSPAAEPAIIFRADRSTVSSGELVTLQWSVTGEGEISISNIGTVQERRGSKTLILSRTTEFSLVAGRASRTIVVYVTADRQPFAARLNALVSGLSASLRANVLEIPKALWLVALVTCFSAILYLSLRDAGTAGAVMNASVATATDRTPFRKEKVEQFLNELYSFYNKGYVNSVLNHYAGHLDQYRDQVNVDKATLNRIIAARLWRPGAYHCMPAMYSLSLHPENGQCTLSLTLYEQARPRGAESTASYTTVLQYVLNRDYQIVSEKVISQR